MSTRKGSRGLRRQLHRRRNWLRAVTAVAATALVLPMAACQSGGDQPTDKTSMKGSVSASVSGVQRVAYTLPAPSPQQQDSDNALAAAMTSYAYAVLLLDELLEAGESGEVDPGELQGMLDQTRAAYQQAELDIRAAAAALQRELGSDWRDLDLLEPEDLEDNTWASAVQGSDPFKDQLGEDGAAVVEPAAWDATAAPTVTPPCALNADEDDGEAEDSVFDRVLLDDPRDAPGKHLGSLATMMNTGASAADEVLAAAQELLEAGREWVQEHPEAWHTLATTAHTTVRVGVKAGGIALTGAAVGLAIPVGGTVAGAAAVLGGTVAVMMQGADLIFEVVKGGAAIIEGPDGKTAAQIEPGQDAVSALGFAVSLGTTGPQAVAQGTAEAGKNFTQSAVVSLTDFGLGQIEPGGILNVDIGDVAKNGGRTINATTVQPGATPEETLANAEAAGLNVQENYVSVGQQENDVNAIKNSLAVRSGARGTSGISKSTHNENRSAQSFMAAITGTYTCTSPQIDEVGTMELAPAGEGSIAMSFQHESLLLHEISPGTFSAPLPEEHLENRGLTGSDTWIFSVSGGDVQAQGTRIVRWDGGRGTDSYTCHKID